MSRRWRFKLRCTETGAIEEQDFVGDESQLPDICSGLVRSLKTRAALGETWTVEGFAEVTPWRPSMWRRLMERARCLTKRS